MAITKEHIRFFIHFASHLKKNAAEATAMICATYGENTISHTTCKRWYQKFRQEDFSLEDEQRAERPQKIETRIFQDINSAQIEKELAVSLQISRNVYKPNNAATTRIGSNRKASCLSYKPREEDVPCLT